MGDPYGSEEVRVEDFLRFLQVGLLSETFVHHAGVVDQHVKAARTGKHLLDALLNRLWGPDVEAEHFDALSSTPLCRQMPKTR